MIKFQKPSILGIVLIFVGLSILSFIYFPVAREEVKYQARKIGNKGKEIAPVNMDFSLVIPKLGINVPVVKNVNPLNSKEYLEALKEGVAHASTSSLPDAGGNTFIFAHSTDAFYNVNKYNAIFYLLGKLGKEDEVFVYYKGQKIAYSVEETKVVEAREIDYYKSTYSPKTLVLQTCYPPGTNLKRLIVVARQVN